MSALVYGVPVPAGVKADWDASSMGCENAGEVARRFHVPADWGAPTNAVAWFAGDDLRVLVCQYSDGRQATLRRGRGKWTTTLGRQASEAPQ